MRVLICGGRFWSDHRPIRKYIASLEHDTVVIVGAAKGADSIAEHYARLRHLTVEVYPAEWDRLGRSAGPIRNQRMLDEGRPDKVIAFWDGLSPGTRDMLQRARRHTIPYFIFWASAADVVQAMTQIEKQPRLFT